VNAKSLVIGLVAAAVIGYVAHALALPIILPPALGAAVGALMRHEESSRDAAVGFIAAAALALIPLGGLEAYMSLALLGYTVARHA